MPAAFSLVSTPVARLLWVIVCCAICLPVIKLVAATAAPAPTPSETTTAIAAVCSRENRVILTPLGCGVSGCGVSAARTSLRLA